MPTTPNPNSTSIPFILPNYSQIFTGGLTTTQEEPKSPVTCTCGEAAVSRSKNHWADCALVTTK